MFYVHNIQRFYFVLKLSLSVSATLVALSFFKFSIQVSTQQKVAFCTSIYSFYATSLLLLYYISPSLSRRNNMRKSLHQTCFCLKLLKAAMLDAAYNNSLLSKIPSFLSQLRNLRSHLQLLFFCNYHSSSKTDTAEQKSTKTFLFFCRTFSCNRFTQFGIRIK